VSADGIWDIFRVLHEMTRSSVRKKTRLRDKIFIVLLKMRMPMFQEKLDHILQAIVLNVNLKIYSIEL